MWEPRRRHRPYPYYKIQVLSDVFLCWKDVQGAFDTVGEAEEYIARKLAPRKARIMIVEEKGRHVLE